AQMMAIYKPHRGEQLLYDFPDGLYRREVAAYRLADALGWPRIPETIVRPVAPFGVGSLQRFIEADFDQHYFTMLEEPRHRAQLQAMSVFDMVANNADRKGGHCLLGRDGRLWGIDHGLCFHELPKLRTVIWDFAGEPISDDHLSDLARLAGGGLPRPLTALLHDEECRALEMRISALLRHRRLPEPRTDRPYPWPLV
ncbi:MAG: SCO1664 family protein, partial [Acidimicrobiales bacterium]